MILTDYHIFGLVTGLATFLIIGMFHPVVIKCHYHFGVGCWWWFLVLGIVGAVGSYMVDDLFLSTLSGVFAFSSFWTIKEIFDQEKRVEKGWFPANPKHQRQKESGELKADAGRAKRENYV